MRVTEGQTVLSIPNKVFFNPEMIENRDTTVALLNAFFKKPFSACDALSGTGAKGIRVANETKSNKVFLNDLNPNSKKAIEKNVELNSLKNIEFFSKDANVLLSENKHSFNFIDIDPFGSPAPFLDSACRALLPKNAILAVTATDTGALCGSFESAALRRYGMRLKKTSFYNELGLRALAGYTTLVSGKYDIGLEPVFAHVTKHYLRVFMKSSRGRTSADKAVKKVRSLYYDSKTDNRSFTKVLPWVLGPVWSESLFDKKLVKKMRQEVVFPEEIEYDQIYFNLHALAKKHSIPLKKFSEVLEKVGGSRTKWNKYGIKTNASFDEVIKALGQQ